MQHTGTELQARTWAYKNAQRVSAWVTVPTSQIIQLVLTSDPATGERLYINGQLAAQQNTFVGENTIAFNGATQLGIIYQGIFASSNSPQPKYYFAATWGRPLSEPEVREISDNPLQLLKSSTRTFYTTMPSGVIVPRNRFLFFFN
jgi:hypothetical protein